MATNVISNSAYKGDSSVLPATNAPMPNNASLYLDFQSGLYIGKDISTGNVTRSTLTSDLLSFSRTTVKSVIGIDGLIRQASSGELAIQYDAVTKNRLGCTIHNASANLAIYSEDFSQTSWTKTGVTTTAAAAIAPDGNSSATLVSDGSATSAHTIEETTATATTTGNYLAFSIYVKPGTARYVQLYALATLSGSTYANFDLQTGRCVKMSANAVQAGITAEPNGFYRLSLSIKVFATYSAGGAGIAFINNAPGSTMQPSYTGTGLTAYVWGGQLEVREAPTPYMVTSGASFTRSLDVLNANASTINFLSLTAGTVFVEAYMPSVNQSPAGVMILGNAFFGLENTDGSANYLFFTQKPLTTNNGSVQVSSYVSPSSSSMNTKHNVAPAGKLYRGMVSFDASDIITYDDFGSTESAISTAVSHFGRMLIGRGHGTGNSTALPFNGTIKRIIYFPSKLTISQMSAFYNSMV